MKILRIDSSSRFAGSYSRETADLVEKKLLDLHPDAEVVVRDIINKPIPHITDETINAFELQTPPNEAQQEAVKLSNALIGELLAADILLISVPMYNFSVPSALKAYIDHIVRPNKTFKYAENGPTGLLKDKKCYVAAAYGAVYTDSELGALNFLTPYLRSLMEFLGFETIEFFQLEGTDLNPEGLQQGKNRIMAQIEALR